MGPPLSQQQALPNGGRVFRSFLEWCRAHPSETITGGLVFLLHVVVLAFISTQREMPTVFAPKGHVIVKTVQLNPKSALAALKTGFATAQGMAVAKTAPPAIHRDPAKTESKTAEVETESRKEEVAAPTPVKKAEKPRSQAKSSKTAVRDKAGTKSKGESAKNKQEVIQQGPFKKKKLPLKRNPGKVASKTAPKGAVAEEGPQISTKQQALLDNVKATLDRVSAARSANASDVGEVAYFSSMPLAAAPGLLTLAIDAEEVGVENGLTEHQMGYCEELVSRLKLHLRLPEVGKVVIKLTLSKLGSVSKVETVALESSLNGKYIENTLPAVNFPSFGPHFGEEEEHTFLLALCNE